jgi:hypothetical protein
VGEDRERALPQLHEIVADLLSGKTSATEFRWAMDSFSKRSGRGFGDLSGQMFFQHTRQGRRRGDVGRALRAAPPAPADEDDSRRKFFDFLAFVEEARERA